MQHAETTKTNDAVTLGQFHRFLVNAKLPPRWKCSVKKLNDVLQMPVIMFGCRRIEFFVFVVIFKYIPPFLHIALKCSTYSPRRSTYSPRRSTYSPRTGAICNYIALYGGNMQIFYPRYYRGISYIKKTSIYRVGKWDIYIYIYIYIHIYIYI